MAEVTEDQLDEEPVAAEKSRGVALADEAPDELPALLAIAVGVAILAITIVWPSIANNAVVEPAPVEETAEVVEEEEPVEEEEVTPAVELLTQPDLDTFGAGLASAGLAPVALSGIDSNIVTATGEVPDEETRTAIVDFLEQQPKVDEVRDEMTVVSNPQAESKISASQNAVVLTGTVPDEATETALVERATAIWSRDGQVDNQLVIDAEKQAPTKVTVEGQVSDQGLFARVQSGFNDIEGVEVDTEPFTLADESDLEQSLNELEPIEFGSGSALIEPASEAILDQAADLLKANPDITVEIGGHTDSRGTDVSNKTLSDSRAQSVKEALESRGVENELIAVGYGEERLREPDDADDPEAQRRNRRIEYREL